LKNVLMKIRGVVMMLFVL